MHRDTIAAIKEKTSIQKCGIIGAVLICLYIPANAAWPVDPATNLFIAGPGNIQDKPAIAPDGAGGAIIAWEDPREADQNIYAQRVDHAGDIQWAENGISVCYSAGDRSFPSVISDGEGGAYIAWLDYRDSAEHMYAQRVDASGNLLWDSAGVLVSTGYNYFYSRTAPSSDGGFFVAWSDDPLPYDWTETFVQKVSHDGVVSWPGQGLKACTLTCSQSTPRIVSNGSGGAIILWRDSRNNYSIFGQNISFEGALLWGSGGIEVSTLHPYSPLEAISDGAGGAILGLINDVPVFSAILYLQKVTYDGALPWGPEGVHLLYSEDYGLSSFGLTSDQAGGAIVFWSIIGSTGTALDLFGQRVHATGNTLWGSNGITICNALEDQWYIAAAGDGTGGAFLAWEDDRADPDTHIYAQHLGPMGQILGPDNGWLVSSRTGNKDDLKICSDDMGGAIVTWEESGDIYAQWTDCGGATYDQVPAMSVPSVILLLLTAAVYFTSVRNSGKR